MSPSQRSLLTLFYWWLQSKWDEYEATKYPWWYQGTYARVNRILFYER